MAAWFCAAARSAAIDGGSAPGTAYDRWATTLAGAAGIAGATATRCAAAEAAAEVPKLPASEKLSDSAYDASVLTTATRYWEPACTASFAAKFGDARKVV